MTQNLYDANYIDKIELIKVAQKYDLDANAVAEADTLDALLKQQELIHKAARKKDPNFCNSDALLKLLRQLDAVRAADLEVALTECESKRDFKRWKHDAHDELEKAQIRNRELYGNADGETDVPR